MPLEADGSAAETIVNTSAIDVLRRLPGVTEGNYRPLMQAAGESPVSRSSRLTALKYPGMLRGVLLDINMVVYLPPFCHVKLECSSAVGTTKASLCDDFTEALEVLRGQLCVSVLAGSLAELAKIPLEQLVKIMGSVNLGRKLREWLDAVTPIAR